MFKAPDGNCLSPLGEYNLNLGIRKVLQPDYVATARDRPCAYEGHPFLVEAAVSLGGKDAKEGISVVRFANRIPLLFEAGADVSTKVAQKSIKWSSYKMDHKRDKIGVFVSIVSTKIPYKGTGKEYIGPDITEIATSVKRALQSCCQQLRVHLLKRNALRDQKERKSRLSRYIPDATRALYGLLDGMRSRHRDPPPLHSSPRKRARRSDDVESLDGMVKRLEDGDVTQELIKSSLEAAVDVQNSMQERDEAAKSRKTDGIPLHLVPLLQKDIGAGNDFDHPLFIFRYLPSSRT